MDFGLAPGEKYHTVLFYLIDNTTAWNVNTNIIADYNELFNKVCEVEEGPTHEEIKKEARHIEEMIEEIVIPNLETIKEKLFSLNEEVLRIEEKLHSIIATLKKLDIIIQQNKDIEEKLDCLIISIPQNNQAPGNLDKCREELMAKYNLTERRSK